MKSDYTGKLYQDYEKLQNKYDHKVTELKHMELRALVAEDEQHRLEKVIEKKENIIQQKNAENKDLKKEIQKLQREIERLKAKENNDGTTSGIPTSQTPIGKKKVIPNFAKNTGEKNGRKQGHKKDKLEKVSEEKINNHVEHKMEECPACHKKDLKSTGKVIKKQVKDYYIIVNYTEHEYIEYECSCCGKKFHEPIPNHLKEECQYGSNVKSLALLEMSHLIK